MNRCIRYTLVGVLLLVPPMPRAQTTHSLDGGAPESAWMAARITQLKAQLEAVERETLRRLNCQIKTQVSTADGCQEIPGLRSYIAGMVGKCGMEGNGECEVESFTVVGSNSGVGTVVVPPQGARTGDLAVVYTHADGHRPPHDYNGMTRLVGRNGDASAAFIFAKILAGNESTITGPAVPDNTSWLMLVLRPNAKINGFTAHAPSSAWNWQHQAGTIMSGTAPKRPAVVLAHAAGGFEVGPMWQMSLNMARLNAPRSPEQHYSSHQVAYHVFTSTDTLENITWALHDGGSRQKTNAVTLVFN